MREQNAPVWGARLQLLNRAAIACAVSLAVGACGSSSSSSDDDAPPPGDPAPPDPANTMDIPAELAAMQVVGGSDASGSASADLTLDLDTGALSGTVTLDGVDADSVTLNRAFAGDRGPVLVTLQESSATQWTVPDSSMLTENDRDDLDAGALYLVVTTDDAPDGALRGQLIVGDIQLFFTPMSGLQEVPVVDTAGSAMGATTVDPDTGDVVVHINTTQIDDAIAAHVHQAPAGVNAPVLIGFEQDPDDDSRWSSPEDASLDDDALDALAAGGLYLNVHTPDNMGGEVRGQIRPADLEILIVPLSGDEVVPSVDTTATGTAAVTADPENGDFLVHVNLVDADDATMVQIHEGEAGTNGDAIIDLAQDSDNVAHWFADETLTDAQLTAFANDALYVNVHTPDNPDGELRGQIISEAEAEGVTFTFIQENIFTPTCAVAGCHDTGTQSAGQDLSAGQAFDNIVGVPSSQMPDLLRVDPGNSEDSYMVHKLEGRDSITGGRMPLGGGALDSDLLQALRDWIDDGAPNN